MRLLLDADILLFQAAEAAQTSVDWGNGIWSNYADEKQAQQIFDQKVQACASHFKSNDVVLCLSDKAIAEGGALPWRKKVMPGYKHNRSKAKPLVYWALYDRAKAQYNCKWASGLEGDDVMGLLADVGSVIVSPDKDMTTIPGKLARGFRNDIITITEIEATFNHLIFALAGDPTDGFSGCPGIGPVKARRILENVEPGEHKWQTIVGQYGKQRLTEEDALRSARVARVLRGQEYNWKTGEVCLWTPDHVSSDFIQN